MIPLEIYNVIRIISPFSLAFIFSVEGRFQVHLVEQEKVIGIWLKLETSNISMNLWSETLAFAAANRWYSSNIDVKHHFWSFLKHPTRQPVLCCKFQIHTQKISVFFLNVGANRLKKMSRIGEKNLPCLAYNESELDGFSHLWDFDKTLVRIRKHPSVFSCVLC